MIEIENLSFSMLSLFIVKKYFIPNFKLIISCLSFIRLATIVFIHLHRYEFLDILIHLLRILRARRQDYLNQV
ncbi:hypothetical protein SA21338_1832 [Staphylococcus aureus subsp. aureus 21338]|nr:hypothetical protein SA21193_1268 [Staphylococcus aureus subsp. aureus 21193]EZI08780.1 hypothetical protein SA21338_1832 [Staphylococcus aureus subsp. aureus 21338]